ncbi:MULTISPECIES: N-acetylglucosamine-6-phosphate deacetylase [Halomonas]|uniref:N-acetylglucosamine-6-phosphate deacetylase n=1 Tax=Halomonas TaxID=2745 RepID=UPI001A8F5E8D|nr:MULTISPECIES: N-acetylglucosamine-6-phosphate deacetylase [Halomonas]MED5296655.1 N-acetylglucosamine-6-phosphate deacetylase [Pseudomonadota bacterium]MBN8414186.1 N-acetylglucosamine-6-phosphate deacetylase [Halomonas litopenaei]MBY5970374.1 N-acetylglucosamine-6-phosphate deacetylase [Halomonas denitrificans]MBY6027779.1 N-acetylglucosamine-6-phosphate deacetylase [Halomonas sp. DP8Y7-1]MEE3214251.1 N-acetylglucosamine-6-phosphate deacetylase [Pseudomonadota bacterium]
MTIAATRLSGNILTPEGWLLGHMRLEDGRIAAIEGRPVDPEQNDAPRLIPGFIDLHVHGGGGADAMEGAASVATLARTHLRFGTTSLLATTMTATPAQVRAVLREISTYMREPEPQASRVLGVHLEGPYINPGKLGAQPAHAQVASVAEMDELLALAPILVVTLAAEISGHGEVIRHLSEQGVKVQLGHTLGSYEDGVEALAHGACGFTHLFNAMTGLHHRKPGMAGAALAHAEYAEIIPDLLHVHPGAIRTALRCIPRLYAVTDSTAAAGMPDGDYRLGSQTVSKCLGGVRLADGTLAGSTLTMDQALRNFVGLGLSLAEASDRLSRFPADFLGRTDVGRLEVGARADVVTLDPQLTLLAVHLDGHLVSGDPHVTHA